MFIKFPVPQETPVARLPYLQLSLKL